MIKSVIIKQKEYDALIDAQKLMGSCASPAHIKSAEIIGELLARYDKAKAMEFNHKCKKGASKKETPKKNCCMDCKLFSLMTTGGKLTAYCVKKGESPKYLSDPKSGFCKSFESSFKPEM